MHSHTLTFIDFTIIDCSQTIAVSLLQCRCSERLRRERTQKGTVQLPQIETYYTTYVRKKIPSKTVNVCVGESMCVPLLVCSCCEVTQGFVKGMSRGLSIALLASEATASSQAMCSASFVHHIIMRCPVLPYYCHMVAKHCKASTRNEEVFWDSMAQSPLQFSVTLARPVQADLCWCVERREEERQQELRERQGVAARAASLGEVPDHCWHREED